MGERVNGSTTRNDSSGYHYRDVVTVCNASTTSVNIRDRWNTILCRAIAEEKDIIERNWLRSQII